MFLSCDSCMTDLCTLVGSGRSCPTGERSVCKVIQQYLRENLREICFSHMLFFLHHVVLLLYCTMCSYWMLCFLLYASTYEATQYQITGGIVYQIMIFAIVMTHQSNSIHKVQHLRRAFFGQHLKSCSTNVIYMTYYMIVFVWFYTKRLQIGRVLTRELLHEPKVIQ